MLSLVEAKSKYRDDFLFSSKIIILFIWSGSEMYGLFPVHTVIHKAQIQNLSSLKADSLISAECVIPTPPPPPPLFGTNPNSCADKITIFFFFLIQYFSHILYKKLLTSTHLMSPEFLFFFHFVNKSGKQHFSFSSSWKDKNMQKLEFVVQIIHLQVWNFLHFFIYYIEKKRIKKRKKTLCTHIFLQWSQIWKYRMMNKANEVYID